MTVSILPTDRERRQAVTIKSPTELKDSKDIYFEAYQEARRQLSKYTLEYGNNNYSYVIDFFGIW
jgi:hypothetical protein